MSDTIVRLETTDSDLERMFKDSLILEAEKSAHKRTYLKVDTLQKFLRVWLCEFEAKWDNDETCDSPEIAMDYIVQATYMRDNFGRKENRIDEVKKWVDDYLPWNAK